MKLFVFILMLFPITLIAQQSQKNTNAGTNYGKMQIGDIYNIDTIKLKHLIEKSLKKAGIKQPQYQLSINTSGGSIVIANNYIDNSRNVFGNNYGINGDINNGIPYRKISEQEVRELLKSPEFNNINRNTSVSFSLYGFGDSEIYDVIKQITQILHNIGFENIDTSPRIGIGFEIPNKIMFYPSPDGSTLSIGIPPATK